MKLIINASNLHIGGGVQVASSFIYDLYKLSVFDVTIVCSKVVYENLPNDINEHLFDNFIVMDVYGVKSIFDKRLRGVFNGYDVCFTIFGPFYPKINVKKHICGFAQPWIAYPNNTAYSKLSVRDKLKNKLKFFIQGEFFKKYDELIVEQEHVKKALNNIKGFTAPIHVVENAVSSIFDDVSKWEYVRLPTMEHSITIGFIGRPYVHKNIDILSKVNEVLINDIGVKVNFLFTFTGAEMEELGFDLIENFYSIGALKLEQCPEFYNCIDFLIFPSLLECFSASPIEALKMNKLVLASDLPFITGLNLPNISYFEPLNAESIALLINKTIDDGIFKRDLSNDFKLYKSQGKSEERAKQYLKILNYTKEV